MFWKLNFNTVKKTPFNVGGIIQLQCCC